MSIFSEGSVSPQDIGVLILSVSVLVIMADRIKALFFPNKSIDQELVRKADLAEYKTNLMSLLATYVSRLEMQKLESKFEILSDNQKTIADSHKALGDFTQKNVQDLLEKINAIAIRIEVMHRDISKEVGASGEKVIARLEIQEDDQRMVIDKLSSKLEVSSARLQAVETHIMTLRRQDYDPTK